MMWHPEPTLTRDVLSLHSEHEQPFLSSRGHRSRSGLDKHCRGMLDGHRVPRSFEGVCPQDSHGVVAEVLERTGEEFTAFGGRHLNAEAGPAWPRITTAAQPRAAPRRRPAARANTRRSAPPRDPAGERRSRP